MAILPRRDWRCWELQRVFLEIKNDIMMMMMMSHGDFGIWCVISKPLEKVGFKHVLKLSTCGAQWKPPKRFAWHFENRPQTPAAIQVGQDFYQKFPRNEKKTMINWKDTTIDHVLNFLENAIKKKHRFRRVLNWHNWLKFIIPRARSWCLKHELVFQFGQCSGFSARGRRKSELVAKNRELFFFLKRFDKNIT